MVRLLSPSAFAPERFGGASAGTAMKLTRNQFFKVVVGGSAWLVSAGFARRIRNAGADAARPPAPTAGRPPGRPPAQGEGADAKGLPQPGPGRGRAPHRRRA